jgi:hypothetical protein
MSKYDPRKKGAEPVESRKRSLDYSTSPLSVAAKRYRDELTGDDLVLERQRGADRTAKCMPLKRLKNSLA